MSQNNKTMSNASRQVVDPSQASSKHGGPSSVGSKTHGVASSDRHGKNINVESLGGTSKHTESITSSRRNLGAGGQTSEILLPKSMVQEA